jgi:acyl-CoA thioester hydrolase
MRQNKLTYKVYLEDTDAFGIVYHANYLKYCERGRTEILEQCGCSIGKMHTLGCTFVVFDMNLKFHRPSRLHDELEVVTQVVRGSDYRANFEHKVFLRGSEQLVFSATATVVTIDEEGVLCPIPEHIEL